MRGEVSISQNFVGCAAARRCPRANSVRRGQLGATRRDAVAATFRRENAKQVVLPGPRIRDKFSPLGHLSVLQIFFVPAPLSHLEPAGLAYLAINAVRTK